MPTKAILVVSQTGLIGTDSWTTWYFGEASSLLHVLVAFVATDYLTGVAVAIRERTVSSSVGFRGISRKVLIFALVGLSNILDTEILLDGSLLRSITIVFYISNEGLSIIENASKLKLPVPKVLRQAISNINKDREDKPHQPIS